MAPSVGSRWLSFKRAPKDEDQNVAFGDVLYVGQPGSNVWRRGVYEFVFQIVLPGYLSETMYTDQKRVSYELRATLFTGALGGAKRSAVQRVAVKRVPYFGAMWDSLANDTIHVTAKWRDRIEMCALGCGRVQRDDQTIRVTGVVRALEKGYRLTKVGFIIEERTKSRLADGAGLKCTSSIAARSYLKPRGGGENGGWFGSLIVDQMAFSIELQIPKAYRKIQYDIKHGSVTITHRLAFVIAVVDELGCGTSLRLFTPLHIMPLDWVASGYELPSYINSLGDRVLLSSDTQAMQAMPNSCHRTAVADAGGGNSNRDGTGALDENEATQLREGDARYANNGLLLVQHQLPPVTGSFVTSSAF
ncbi:hypothetical protein GGI12_000380 [Dipsacomyces acuminosporus]|nr:hypothetical protein GGI12_000380 [Dipsacomyces acuminosporus]